MNPSPLVSVLMAAHNVEAFIDDALLSVRGQTYRNLEIVVVDDASTDSTATLVAHHAQLDPRVRCISGRFGGPAAARNRAIAEARGEWLLICDADDLMHPRRTEKMLGWAAELGAAIVGDELIAFSDTAEERKAWLFIGRQDEGPSIPVTTAELFGLNAAGMASNFGYLKPMVDVRALRRVAGSYREHLTIGEDFDFLAQFILRGEKVVYVPEPYYLYRRRSQSISHRIDSGQINQMLAANDAVLKAVPGSSPDAAIIRDRSRRLRHYAQSVALIDRLKAFDLRSVAVGLARQPGSLKLLARSLSEAVKVRLKRPAAAKADPVNSLRIGLAVDGRTRVQREAGHAATLFVGSRLPEWAEAAAEAVALGRHATVSHGDSAGLEDIIAYGKAFSALPPPPGT